MSGHDAAVRAMSELFGPIIGITLVLMAVFLPSAFVPGLSGQMFAQFALVIAVTALISAVNAATLKPTQCALWLRPPKPPEQRNLFYRGFNRVYDKAEGAYTRLIGGMVRHGGIMVAIGLALACLGIYGIARLPTAFIPNEDQGYLMLVAQMPEGAALGRTTAAFDQATKLALDTPGVETVIAISGLSPLDNFASQANAGVSFVVLKPWGERSKAAGTDILSIVKRLQKGLDAAPDGKLFVVPPPPIQGIGNAGGLQMQLELLGGSFDYAKLYDIAQQFIQRAQSDPQLQRVLTTLGPGAPHVTVTVDRARAQTLRVSVGEVFSTLSSYLGSTYINQFNKFGQTFQVYTQAEFELPPAARRHSQSRGPQQRQSDGPVRRSRLVGLAGRTVARDALQPLSLRNGHRRAGPGGQALARRSPRWRKSRRRYCRPMSATEWTTMSYQEKLTGNQLYLPVWLVGAAGLPMPCRAVRKLDPAARGSVRGAAGVARPGRGADRSRRRQQSLYPDRAHSDDCAVGQERHPDRRDGARGPYRAWQADP